MISCQYNNCTQSQAVPVCRNVEELLILASASFIMQWHLRYDVATISALGHPITLPKVLHVQFAKVVSL